MLSSCFVFSGIEPATIAHIWKTAIRPVLSYSTQCLSLCNKSIQELDRTQARLLKSALGISKYCKSTQLLEALNVHTISTLINVYSMDLIRSHFRKTTKGKLFYYYVETTPVQTSSLS
jgi:hypothetical protein